MRRMRMPASDFLSEIENDPRVMLGRDEMAQIPFSELLTGGEYEDPGFEMNLPGEMGFQAMPQDADYRGRGVEGRGRVVPTQEIPSTGRDFMPDQMQRRFRNQDLSPAAREAFAFPVESGETTIDAKRRALKQLEDAMTDEQRLEYEIQKQNWLRDQRLR